MVLPFALIFLGQGKSQLKLFLLAFVARLELAGIKAGIMGFAQWIIATATTQALGLTLSEPVCSVVWFVVGFGALSAFSSLYGFCGKETPVEPENL